LVLAIATVVVLTALLDQRHNYWYNPADSAINILRQTALLGIFSLGSAIVIIAGGIDLSSGSMIAFSGSICATLMVLLAPEQMMNALPVGLGTNVIAILGTLVVGLLIGSLHAWLITVVGLPPFIATLATLVGLRSLARAIVENVTAATWGGRSTQIQIYDSQFRYLATSVWIPVLVFIILAALAWLLMSRTVIGRHLHALGGNEQAARLSGIRTDRLKWLAYCLSAVSSAIAGILYIGDQSVAAPQTLGLGYELNAIAAAVVGGCSLRGGVGTIPGTVLGVLFLRTVIDGVAKVIKTGADVYEGLIVGSVVVIAVALTQFRQAGRRGKRFLSGVQGMVTIVNLALLAGVLAALLAPKTALGERTLALTSAVVTLVILFLLRLVEGRSADKTAAANVLPGKSDGA
jgi:ribose/xylose/arabinose/galactoside ABC-type transport system permease subunit